MNDSLVYVIVKGTLVLLVAFSAATWSLVVLKALQNARVARDNDRFGETFARYAKLPSVAEIQLHAGPIARVALAGAEAWNEASSSIGAAPDTLEARRDFLERRLRQQLQTERRTLEGGLAVFASIGTTAPFIGLFGTVFGIIHALGRISGAGSASLDVVAGPIGEALVATGVGIAVAVPAVISYNIFVRRAKGVVGDLDDFTSTFVNAAVKASFLGGAAPRVEEVDSAKGAASVAHLSLAERGDVGV